MPSALRRRPLPGCGYAAVAKGIGHVCHLVGSPPVRRRRASRHGCWIGGVVVAAACLGAAAWVAPPFLGLMNQVKGFEQMTVPGAVTVHVPRPGIRVLYVEGPRTAGRAGKAVAWVTADFSRNCCRLFPFASSYGPVARHKTVPEWSTTTA